MKRIIVMLSLVAAGCGVGLEGDDTGAGRNRLNPGSPNPPTVICSDIKDGRLCSQLPSCEWTPVVCPQIYPPPDFCKEPFQCRARSGGGGGGGGGGGCGVAYPVGGDPTMPGTIVCPVDPPSVSDGGTSTQPGSPGIGGGSEPK